MCKTNERVRASAHIYTPMQCEIIITREEEKKREQSLSFYIEMDLNIYVLGRSVYVDRIIHKII